MSKLNRRKNFQPQQGLIETLEPRLMLAADLASLAVPQPTSAIAESTVNAQSQRSNNPSLAAFLRSVENAASTAAQRTFNGTGNNRTNTQLGSVGQQLARAADSQYTDGISSPAGVDRPSPREISNALVAQGGETASARQLSAYIFAWGQFIDHDIDLTVPPVTDLEAFPIAVPQGDPLFDPSGTGDQVIPLTRSGFDAATGTSVENPREQINEISAWIDGSMVYGSDKATADSLRTFNGGQLKTSAGNLPPVDANGNFLAGDVRANENIELTSMHTLFVREHNYWAEQISKQNPKLTDEQIYQQARAIVIAEIQSVTFNEFLPALLGEDAISDYAGYDPTVDPSVANEFSTAAFRLHTLINDEVGFFGNDGRAVRDEVELAEAFNNPELLRETGADSVLKFLASNQAQEFDPQIVDSLRNFLFGQPGEGGLDLASLNIQRGRDHGLADYNSVREAYGLARVESFEEITSDVQVQQQLESLYGSVDNIDLWVGALAEDHVAGSSVGELVQTIVSDQFERLRDADRFWYQNVFSGAALQRIENTSLSDIISRNTSMNNLQDNVFFMRAEVTGQVFVDTNGNGRLGRNEQALRGVTVELLNDEGAVIATTLTDSRGNYRFDAFRETGDYEVRINVPKRMTATTATSVSLLVSRGDFMQSGVNFGVRSQKNSSPTPRSWPAAAPQSTQATSLDSVLLPRDTTLLDSVFSQGDWLQGF